jgi:hypothetical protein
MLNTAWKKARNRASLEQVRVHDLRHTFGRRLRAAGVSFEDRQDLLGHKSGKMTTHYSMAELTSLIRASNMACEDDSRKKSQIHHPETQKTPGYLSQLGVIIIFFGGPSGARTPNLLIKSAFLST